MYEVNPKCCAISNPGNEPILDGDTKRILEICNDGNVKETKELILIVPERKLDGHVPPHAAPLYEDEDFIAETIKLIEDHDDYELMRTLNEQYESNFLRFQKLWFGQDSDQVAEIEKKHQDKTGL